MARTMVSTLVSHCFRVNAVVQPISRATISSSRKLNGSQRKSDAETTPLPVFTRRDWPQNWTLEELARLEDMWKEGKTIAAIYANGFPNRSLATVRDLLRIMFSRNTGKVTRLSLNQSRITEHDKKEMLTLHKQGETV